MDTLTPDVLKETLAEVVRDALSAGEDVVLPDLGILRVESKPSEFSKDENGRIIMRPPRDLVVFYPGDY